MTTTYPRVSEVVTRGQTYTSPVLTPIGIATGAAYADKDAMGVTPFAFEGVPRSGILQTAWYYDKDDEGLGVKLWLFDTPPSQQTDNGAFTLLDTEIESALYVASFNSFEDAANCQFSVVSGIGLSYKLPSGTGNRIWALVQAGGALNIAAGSLPGFKIAILAD